MTKRFIICLALAAAFAYNAFSQEWLTGLADNPVVRAEYEKLRAQGPDPSARISREVTPLQLPFFDDFHQAWIYPDERRWMDNEAYINTNFGYRSANIGVATLDAIDSRGRLHANASQFPFQADSLTSLPIRLDSLFHPAPRAITVADSIYFSFYYQPEGRGNRPESFDSLILQFGYYTGDSIFTFKYDSLWVPLSQYIQPGDTVFPGDTLYSPSGTCAPGLFTIAGNYYYYEDLIQVPCDSVFIPEFRWDRAWSSRGMSLQEFYNLYGTYSKLVMIPLTDSVKFYQKDFQFRFINFASLASENNQSWRANCDQWNLDYIYLNIGRSYKDTTFRDVTFAERAPSMLKNYEAMPYNQYVNDPTNEMKGQLDLLITNMDTTIYNSTYYYVVYEVDGAFQYLYPGGNCNLFPFRLNGYQNCISCAAHACPPVNFIFPLSTKDSAEFEIRHYIIGDLSAQDTIADTLSFRQKFHNYYAYDDGTPELGYGLTPAGSKLAYRFRLNTKDTLRAVQMFFNRAQNNANEDYFDLMVWRDNNGKPGDVLYRQPNMKVEFSEYLLGFHTYMLEEPLPVNGIFYVGWEQLTNDNLNIGFDRYRDAQQQIFYNTDGEWNMTTFQGALLMRPLLGRKFQVSGPEEHSLTGSGIHPYPNPLSGRTIRFQCTGEYDDDARLQRFTVQLYNAIGERIRTGAFSREFDTGELKPGLYIVRILDERGRTVAGDKLIKR